jgi:hypothetical protein
MARIAVNGAVFSLASTFGATKTMSAITNASSAVATLEASHGVSVSDVVQIVTSGWSRAVGRTYRASAVATNDVTLSGFDTQNTTLYPAAAGAGTVREITAYTEVTQILADTLSTSGGTPRRQEFQYLADRSAQVELVGEDPADYSFQIDFDPAASGHILLRTLSDSRVVTPFRIVYAGGQVEYGAGQVFLGVAGILAPNQSVRRQVSITLAGETVMYTS